MKLLERFSYLIALAAAYLSALIMVYMLAHILLEIVLRVFFSTSTFVLDEFIAYATASITFLCLAYSFHDNSLIRVEMLIHKLHGKAKTAFDLASVLVTAAVMSCLAYYFFVSHFWRDYTRGTLSESIAEFPLWIPELLALIGLAIFILQLLVTALRLIAGTRTSVS